MKISASNGNELALSVVGYQFPDADDLRIRYSWHMVNGTATENEVVWHFRWQALTCDESERVGPWLRSVAAAITDVPEQIADHPLRLEFTEPNLAFEVVEFQPGSALLRVKLDLEFHRDRAHWRAGDPYLLDLAVASTQLVDAANEWDKEIARYPDLMPTNPTRMPHPAPAMDPGRTGNKRELE